MFNTPEHKHLSDRNWIDDLNSTGRFNNDQPGRFDHGYGVRPEKLPSFFDDFSIRSIAIHGVESLSIGMQAEVAKFSDEDEQTFQTILDVLETESTDPSILGMCAHLMYVGEKLTDA